MDAASIGGLMGPLGLAGAVKPALGALRSAARLRPSSAAVRMAELPPEFLAKGEEQGANMYRAGRQAQEATRVRGIADAADPRAEMLRTLLSGLKLRPR